MPRKKMTKRKTKGDSNNFSVKTLSKVEKEFFALPDSLVKNANKHLNVLLKKNTKLTKELTKATTQAEKLAKKLANVIKSKKEGKRVIASLKKQHQALLQAEVTMNKEHQQLLQSISSLESFHAKFNFISHQLNHWNKEWSEVKDNQITPIKVKAKKPKKAANVIEINDAVSSEGESLEIPEQALA